MQELGKKEFLIKAGIELKLARQTKKLSIEALSILVDVSYSQISRIENGSIKTSIYNYYKIKCCLEFSE